MDMEAQSGCDVFMTLKLDLVEILKILIRILPQYDTSKIEVVEFNY